MSFDDLKFKFEELKNNPNDKLFDDFCNSVVSYIDGLDPASKMSAEQRTKIKSELYELKSISFQLKDLRTYIESIAESNKEEVKETVETPKVEIPKEETSNIITFPEKEETEEVKQEAPNGFKKLILTAQDNKAA